MGDGHGGDKGHSCATKTECHSKHSCGEKKSCHGDKQHCKSMMMGKCDMSKCAEMTKDECAAMCDSLKCTPEEKEMCLSHFDADGKFIGMQGKKCCAGKRESCSGEKKSCKHKGDCSSDCKK